MDYSLFMLFWVLGLVKNNFFFGKRGSSGSSWDQIWGCKWFIFFGGIGAVPFPGCNLKKPNVLCQGDWWLVAKRPTVAKRGYSGREVERGIIPRHFHEEKEAHRNGCWNGFRATGGPRSRGPLLGLDLGAPFFGAMKFWVFWGIKKFHSFWSMSFEKGPFSGADIDKRGKKGRGPFGEIWSFFEQVIIEELFFFA